ncbi:hypothetical protein QFC21_003074 [Naganishia friedmannii]|uniref:Uncharacterized protein n=1 Tax=Naganishia friedmannii TaxID=89922 RepID=A0ACC2VRN6_9TREE|nr:hypothetical protein QFC21_003074 [Naganishia friedmannii]
MYDGVGKSTIITSLIKESFVQHVQHVVPEVTIPPEVTPENVTTTIVDTSSDAQSRTHLISQLVRAHVICLVYSIAEPSTFERVAEYWLPLFRREGVNVPVILVGNKIDLRGGAVTNEALEEEIAPLMRDFKEIETVVECSARLPLNVSEVFYFAQKAVLHPTAPLYDSREHILKPKCTDALRRIFKVSDVDKDGLLNAMELNQFQQKCFSTPLQLQELEGILDLVRAYDPSCVQPVTTHHTATTSTTPHQSEGITELGFLYLHTIFVQQGRMETTWTVLRKFGYGESLDLMEDVLSPRFDVPYDCSVELSPLGNQFFTDIFEAYDRASPARSSSTNSWCDQDGALSQSELDELFSTSPGNPWIPQGFPDTTITDDGGKVTLQGWLAQWSLGYASSPSSLDKPTTSALKVTRTRKQDRRQKKVTRNVFLCYVLGAAGSGKSSLLRSFVNKRYKGGADEVTGAAAAAGMGTAGYGGYEPTSKTVSVVNSVEMNGDEKYLVLQEFGSKYESEALRNSKKLDLADVLIYVYDSSDTNSFSYISNLRQQYSLDHIPSVFVATKSDLDLAQQRHEVQPDVYARRLGLPVPMSVSVKLGPVPNLWTTITRAALSPTTSLPRGISTTGRLTRRTIITYVGIAGATGGVLAVLYEQVYERGGLDEEAVGDDGAEFGIEFVGPVVTLLPAPPPGLHHTHPSSSSASASTSTSTATGYKNPWPSFRSPALKDLWDALTKGAGLRSLPLEGEEEQWEQNGRLVRVREPTWSSFSEGKGMVRGKGKVCWLGHAGVFLQVPFPCRPAEAGNPAMADDEQTQRKGKAKGRRRRGAAVPVEEMVGILFDPIFSQRSARKGGWYEEPYEGPYRDLSSEAEEDEEENEVTQRGGGYPPRPPRAGAGVKDRALRTRKDSHLRRMMPGAFAGASDDGFAQSGSEDLESGGGAGASVGRGAGSSVSSSNGESDSGFDSASASASASDSEGGRGSSAGASAGRVGDEEDGMKLPLLKNTVPPPRSRPLRPPTTTTTTTTTTARPTTAATPSQRGKPVRLEIICTPAQHRSGRGLCDQMKSLWASWVLRVLPDDDEEVGEEGEQAVDGVVDEIRASDADVGEEVWERKGFNVFFGGDTGYRYAGALDGERDMFICPAFQGALSRKTLNLLASSNAHRLIVEIAHRYGPMDLCLLPISTGSSLSFLRNLFGLSLHHYSLTSAQHSNAWDAIQIAKLMQAKRTIAIHHSTFSPEDEARGCVYEFVNTAKEEGVPQQWEEDGCFIVADIGEVLEIP